MNIYKWKDWEKLNEQIRLFNKFDILFKVIVFEIEKHQEVNALENLNNNIELIKRLIDKRDADPDRYEELCGGRDPIEYLNDKCYLIYRTAERLNCVNFLRNFNRTIEGEQLLNPLKEKL